MASIVARHEELTEFDRIAESDKSEFVAVYGRRRIGKTFLIRNWANNDFAFDVSGILEGSAKEQMTAFYQALKDYGFTGDRPADWSQAFINLRDLLKQKMKGCSGRIKIFIDELPCFDTNGSNFVHALDHFWNAWAAWEDRIMLIVCGSATSWMIRNLIDNKGGLHNRVSHELHLKPFTLGETELYLQSMGLNMPRVSLLQLYMALGGVPYYLNLLQKGESPAQAIDRLYFKSGGEMYREFSRLFKSLYKKPDVYTNIVRALAKSPKGLTRQELLEKLGATSTGLFSSKLEDLVHCDFIRYYHDRNKKKNAGIYQLVDFFTYFYLSFEDRFQTDEHYWSKQLNTPEQNTWFGLSFERVCQTHVEQIKRALRIDAILNRNYPWRFKGNESEKGLQIDMLIERADNMINLCEIKYCKDEYVITAEDDRKMRHRQEVFTRENKLKAGIIPTYITTFGLEKNGYANEVPAQVTLDQLFEN